MHITGPLNIWREKVGRRYLNLDFKPANDDPFRLSLDLLFTGEGVRLGRLKHSAGATYRDRELIQQDNDDCFALLMPRTGSMNIGHQARSIDIQGHEAAVVHNCEPGHVGSMKPCDFLALIVPNASLKAAGINGGELIGRVWRRSNGALQLLKGYLSCIERAPATTSEAVLSAAARHITELTALAAHDALSTASDGARDGDGIRAARLEMAIAYIAENISDPDLSVSSVALRQGVSVRYMHLLFETAGLQFIQHVNDLRLKTAFAALTDPMLDGQTIADIAFSAGFSDISHFNRLFRRRFDATPSAIRSHRNQR
ncbi:MAG: helix-turn-helix domain-containing protein [Hyphomicrobium sp.]